MSRQKIHYYYSRKAVEIGRNEHYKIIYLWAKRCIKKTASLVACHRVSCEKLIAFRTWCSFWLSAIFRFHSSSDADMEKKSPLFENDEKTDNLKEKNSLKNVLNWRKHCIILHPVWVLIHLFELNSLKI